MSVINDADFGYVRELIHTSAAIVLEPGKEYLIESRIGPIARSEGLTITQLIARLRVQPYGPLHHQIVQAMTTNETSWFRDVHPYDALRTTVIPQLIERRRAEQSLTIWSAACSTGQEPYSIAMVLLDDFPELANWRITILASDLAEDAVGRGREGSYSQLEVNRGLPARQLVTHFSREGTHWRVNSRLRSMVRFGVVNLIGPWPDIPTADIVLLRNVMIYFDLDTKRQLLERVRATLRPDGYLFLGNAETTLNIDDRYIRIEPSRAGCYQLRSFVERQTVQLQQPAASRSLFPEGNLT
ncbi:MAG: CheR family methyltransferase [Acidimicrobiales bacterium]